MFSRIFQFLPWVLLTEIAVAANYSNPLEGTNGGDPNIVFHDGWYYMTSTTWSNVKVRRALTLEGLKTGESKTIYETSTASRCCNVWAPELHNVDGIWHVYFSAGVSGNLDYQRSQVLRGGASPWDSFSFLGTINTPGWSIDGTRLTIADQDYFIYSCFRNDTGASLQSLCIATLTSPATITGEEYLLSSPTAGWERSRNPVNEGPYALYRADRTFLTFSASDCWTVDYQLGLLAYNGSGDPRLSSSWTKSGPIFSQVNGNYGTGHNSFFTSPDGSETWMAYHSTPNSAGSCGNRYANAKKIGWNEDGTPNLGEATPYNVVLTGPSGEP